MFCSLAKSWAMAAYTSPSDIKEVIPQFFTVPEIYENISKLPLTVNDEGESIADVQLPKWSRNSRALSNDLLRLLESERVSRQIHQWIDLIFGEKSRGHSAMVAKNLFHPLCYAPVNSKSNDENEESSSDVIEREANIACIISFGQCPQQIYKKSHNQLKSPRAWKVLLSYIVNGGTKSMHICSNWQKLRPESFTMPPTALFVDNSTIITSGQPNASFLPSGQFIFGNEGVIALSTIHTRGNAIEFIKIKECDSLLTLSSISVSRDGLYFCAANRDGSIILFRINYTKQEAKKIKTLKMFTAKSEAYSTEFQETDEITASAISSEHFLLVACCGDKLLQFDIGLYIQLPTLKLGFIGKRVEIDDFAALIFVCGDKNIAIFSISGELICKNELPGDEFSYITCMAISKLPEDFETRFFVTGHSDGSVHFWRYDYENSMIIEAGYKNLYSITANSNAPSTLPSSSIMPEPITVIELSPNSQRLIAASKSNIFCCECIGSSCTPLKKDIYSFECVNCMCDIRKNALVCSKCGRFVCQKCCTKEMNALKTTILCAICQPIVDNTNAERNS